MTGSAALALQGVDVSPRDLDIVADAGSASALIDALGDAVVSDDSPFENEVIRADRRTIARVADVDVDVLVSPTLKGDGIDLGPPDLDEAVVVEFDGRPVPVVPLTVLLRVEEMRGRQPRVEAIRDARRRR